MSDKPQGRPGAGHESETISAFDAAAYIYQLSRELADLARGAGLKALAQLLEQARERSAEEMIAAGRSQSKPEKPDPDDAA